MSDGLTYEARVRVRRQHAIAVLEGIGAMLDRYGNKHNHIVERMQLQTAPHAMTAFAAMIRQNKVSDDDLEFLTWLPVPPRPEATVKVPGKRKHKEGASEWRADRYEDKDNAAIDDIAGR